MPQGVHPRSSGACWGQRFERRTPIGQGRCIPHRRFFLQTTMAVGETNHESLVDALRGKQIEFGKLK